MNGNCVLQGANKKAVLNCALMRVFPVGLSDAGEKHKRSEIILAYYRAFDLDKF